MDHYVIELPDGRMVVVDVHGNFIRPAGPDDPPPTPPPPIRVDYGTTDGPAGAPCCP